MPRIKPPFSGIILSLWIAIGAVAAGVFVTPSTADRSVAVGAIDQLAPPLRRAFTDGGEFEAKKAPASRDWLAGHDEPGQTYAQWVNSKPNLPSAGSTTLYILPIGEFEAGVAPDLPKLKAYAAAYFHPMPVQLLPVLAAREVPAKERINVSTAKKQWRSTDILRWLPRRLPRDAYALIAVTMTDLYPDENWNFVFGQASIKTRVGVFSFARYHPSWEGGPADEATESLVLRRAAKVLTHETGHMFGIRHCVFFQCLMNGANHLEEVDATPMHLCPLCLRKLHHAVRFDPVARYSKIQSFCQANEMASEATWLSRRLTAIQAAK